MTNPKKILIVEDDEVFRKSLQIFLEGYGYSAMAVPNGKLAMNLLGVHTFDTIIADIRLPEVNGIQLLHHVKRTSKIPVILMTGVAEMKDPDEAKELGAYFFLNKPFQQEELLQVLSQCFNREIPTLKSTSVAMNSDDLHFCRLNIDDFISGNELQYDIYVRLSDKKYVKIAHRGDSISPERIATYKAKNIKFLFMKMDDFRKYVGFNVNLTKMIKTSTTLPKHKKLQFMANAAEIILSQLHLDGVNEESFDSARTVMESTLSVIADTDDLFAIVKMLSDHSNHLYAHCLGVALHSNMIAKRVGWQSPNVLFKITMGGLLHDIGKRELPEEIVTKPKSLLTIPEIRILETHTIRGADILSKVASIPTDVIQIAAQHHENCLGLGYPAALKARFIHPMARLVAVGNEFCNLAIRGFGPTPPLSPQESIRNLSSGAAEGLDPTFFIALTQLYNVQLSADFEETLQRRKKFELG